MDMNQDAANNAKHFYRTHRESAGSKRCEWNTKKRGRKINKQTDEKQETHKLCVQSLSHARVEKAHKFISLTRYFHAIPFIFRTNRIVNCKLWKCCHNTTQRWWMAGKRWAVLCSVVTLSSWQSIQGCRIQGRRMPSKHDCDGSSSLFIQNIKFIIIFTVCENCENIN